MPAALLKVDRFVISVFIEVRRWPIFQRDISPLLMNQRLEPSNTPLQICNISSKGQQECGKGSQSPDYSRAIHFLLTIVHTWHIRLDAGSATRSFAITANLAPLAAPACCTVSAPPWSIHWVGTNQYSAGLMICLISHKIPAASRAIQLMGRRKSRMAAAHPHPSARLVSD